MIDLHIHTTYSDGSYKLVDILKKCEEKKLSVISITDHNTCDSYFELEKLNLKNYYNGHIIVGIELNTMVAGIPIEILGYNYDYYKMSELLKKYYLKPEERNKIEFERLVEKCKKYGLILDDNVLSQFDPNIFASVTILKNIQNHKENKAKINETYCQTMRDFYREYMSNPNTPLYVDTSDLIPDLNIAIDLIKKSRWISFCSSYI